MVDEGEILLRGVMPSDAGQLHAIRRMGGVTETVASLTSDRLSECEAYLAGLTDRDHMLVAEKVEGEGRSVILGSATVRSDDRPAMRHSGQIGIIVRSDYQGQRIGRQLMLAIIQLADIDLGLIRLELEVLAQHRWAIHLYEKLGFQIEGIKKFAHTCHGTYNDLLFMARLI